MHLPQVWFALVAVLWTGYFVLEGFDFGVGTLLPVLGRDAHQRRTMLATIGPVWDGNEVWAITAAGATFAAFPDWYASLFSGFYLPLLAMLVALIVRGVALEYRGKNDSPTWRRRCDVAITLGSATPALLWGLTFANIAHGIPLSANHEPTGGLPALLHPFALLGGLTTLALFATHGAVFLALKTTGDLRHRAATLAVRAGTATTVLTATFLTWLLTGRHNALAVAAATAAVVALAAGLAGAARGREGWAFLGTAAAVLLTFTALFTALYPAVLPSTLTAQGTLTIHNAAASPYTLKIMTWLAVLATPIVLLYQGWTYWVFRRRISAPESPAPDGEPPAT